MEPTPKQTAAFGITLFLAALTYVIFWANDWLPFPSDYSFMQRLGLTAAGTICGALIFFAATGLMNILYKVIVETLTAFLIIFNILFVLFCWVTLEELAQEFQPIADDLDINAQLLAAIGILFGIFVFNLVVTLVLIPMARTARTDVLDV